jgi:hypothetical protein
MVNCDKGLTVLARLERRFSQQRRREAHGSPNTQRACQSVWLALGLLRSIVSDLLTIRSSGRQVPNVEFGNNDLCLEKRLTP